MMYIKILIVFLFIGSAFSKTCDDYKNLPDKNVTLSTDKDCKSHEYFYYLNNKKNDEEAKKCAYRELQEKSTEVFGGAAILTMVYANGRGANRDIDLAHKYACIFGGTPAEISARMKTIEELRMLPATFDICDDIKSDVMEGHCMRNFVLKDKELRNMRLEKIQVSFGADSQSAYKKLKAAFDSFHKARLEGEIDRSDQASIKLLVEAEERLQIQYFDRIVKFEENIRPMTMTSENEKYLNSTFQFVLTKGPSGTIKPEGIKLAQLAWERYRKAWFEFAKVRYPKVSQAALSDELVVERIKDLEEIRNSN